MSNELINPYQKFEDEAGAPLENGTVTFYTNLTTTLATIYSDEALTIAQSNPYPLDAAGRIAGDVKFIGTMTLTIKDRLGAFVRTIDNVKNKYDPSAQTVATYAAMDALPALDTGLVVELTGDGIAGPWVVREGAHTPDVDNIRDFNNAVGNQYLRRMAKFETIPEMAFVNNEALGGSSTGPLNVVGCAVKINPQAVGVDNTFAFVDDSQHDPINCTTVAGDANSVNVTHDKPAGSDVVGSCIVAVDETLAKRGIFCGG